MNKKSYGIFNSGIYFDSLKRLCVPGFIFLGIMMFCSIVIPVERYIEIVNSDQAIDTVRVITRILKIFMYTALIYVVVAPVLTLDAFSFLTSRNASDCFHAFPQKRICLFISIYASVISWIVAILGACYITTIIMYTAFGSYISLDLGAYTMFMICMFAASLLVSSACALACSATGTLFTNVVVTGLILFVPRFLTSMLELIFTSSSVILSNESLIFGDNSYNLVFTSVQGLFDSSKYSDFINVPNALYTIIIGIIYSVIAAYMFINRKSEAAGTASVGRKLQAVVRTVLALPVCLIPVSCIFGIAIGDIEEEYLAGKVFTAIISYIIAIAVMIIYELISTRKLANIRRVIPSVIILFSINVVTIAGLTIAYNIELDYTPDDSEVEYVITDALCPDVGGYDDDYFTKKLKELQITDREAIKLITDSLKETVEKEKNDENIYENDDVIDVKIKSGLFIKSRSICIPLEKLRKIMDGDESIKNIYLDLPEFDPSKMAVRSYNTFEGDLNEEKIGEIYTSLVKEAKTIKYEDWYDAMHGEKSEFMTISIDMSDDTTMTLPVTYVTPATLKLAMSYSNENVEKDSLYEIKKILTRYNNDSTFDPEEEEGLKCSISISGYTYSKDKNEYGYPDEEGFEQNEGILMYDNFGEDYIYMNGYEEAMEVLDAAIENYGQDVELPKEGERPLYIIEFQFAYRKEFVTGAYYLTLQPR